MKSLRVAMFVLAASLALPSAPALAQDASTANMEILRQKLKADRKVLIAANLPLTDAEARKFWPIYDSYVADLGKINQRLAKLIIEYRDAYNAGPVSNPTAKKLLAESQNIEAAELKLKRDYVPKLETALPEAKVARFIQIENKIRAAVRYELANAIPLAN